VCHAVSGDAASPDSIVFEIVLPIRLALPDVA
jgi:hypothetical protein